MHMLRKMTLGLVASLALGACSSMTGPNTFEYNADGESEPSYFDGSSIQPDNAGFNVPAPITGEDGEEAGA